MKKVGNHSHLEEDVIETKKLSMRKKVNKDASLAIVEFLDAEGSNSLRYSM